MDMNTLITSIRDAVHDSTGITSWCTATYGHAHKVFVGLDMRKPPGADSYPLIVIHPVSKAAGDARQTHVLGVMCGVHDDSARTVSGKTRLTELKGVQDLESFRKLVETAILGISMESGHWVSRIAMTYESIEFFPYFLADMEVEVSAELAFTEDYYQ